MPQPILICHVVDPQSRGRAGIHGVLQGGGSGSDAELVADAVTRVSDRPPIHLQQLNDAMAQGLPRARAARGFQGTGYGITTTRCELALTRTLLDELKP